MNILNLVLTYGKPINWEDASYSGRLYQVFDLQPGDREYIAEVQEFERGIRRLKVTSLQRYQNPTLLGRFKVHKDQLLFRGEYVEEMTFYHPISKLDLTVALDFNMDVRRYTHTRGIAGHKDPTFYKTPGAAYDALGVGEKVIIVCNLLGSSYDRSRSSISKENDAEYMPIYVAEVN